MKVFIDTNVLIYWVDAGPRADVAEDLLAGDAVVSVQVLNEFANVLRKKRQMPVAAVRELTQTLVATCEVAELTVRTHQAALNLAERYGFSVYDANIIAAALGHGCEVVYSEDMQHGMAVSPVDGAIRTVSAGLSIRNPFL